MGSFGRMFYGSILETGEFTLALENDQYQVYRRKRESSSEWLGGTKGDLSFAPISRSGASAGTDDRGLWDQPLGMGRHL